MHAAVPHRQLNAPSQPDPLLLASGVGLQSPTHVHSPSTQVGVPQRQLNAPSQPVGIGVGAGRHVPKQVGGTEFVQAMTEQVWPSLQPVVTGGLPRTVQREVSSSCVLAVVSTLDAVLSSSLAAEHPNSPSDAPRMNVPRLIFMKMCMAMTLPRLMEASLPRALFSRQRSVASQSNMRAGVTSAMNG
jgi:hypothetical protein